MVLDVAGDKADLVEVVEVIDHFGFFVGGASVAALAREAAKAAPSAEVAAHKMLRRCMAPSTSISLITMFERRQFLAIGHSVVGARHQVIAGILVGLGGSHILIRSSRMTDLSSLTATADAAAFAIDAAAEAISCLRRRTWPQ
jgi:hypothetical protein